MKHLKTLLLVFAPSLLFAQINRNQWLVGGGFTGRYQENSTNNLKAIEARSNLDLGYFALNKLAIGVRGAHTYSKMDSRIFDYYYGGRTITTKESSFAIGPFVRYYILPRTNRFNIYTEFFYCHGNNKYERGSIGQYTSKTNTYNVNIAPVYFINPRVSLEFIAGYYLQKSYTNYSTFLVGLGLQIHLGNGKTTGASN